MKHLILKEDAIMNKRSIGSLACIFLFLYFFNYLHPLSFGDDYLYSFIWQGKPMYTPISEGAIRVSSWHDLFISQWSHYFTWSGRSVAHILIQFFLWMGKDVFNIFNALAGTVLVVEIYWCIHKGDISFEFEPSVLCWIFFVLWAFTPGFTPVFFWLTGACNYLWTNVFLLGFLLPYIRKYYAADKLINKNGIFGLGMFLFGILAGWTNENSVCWIILVLLVFLFLNRRYGCTEKWMYSGLLGLLIGYALLMFAPGNVARLHAEQGTSIWLNTKMLKDNFNTFFMIAFFQIFLWFFVLRAVFSLKHLCTQNVAAVKIKREVKLVRIFYFLAFVMSAMMILSPGFPARSGFLGTVQLVIAAGILLRMQKDYGVELVQENAKKFLFFVGMCYFIITTGVTAYNVYLQKQHMQGIIIAAKQMNETGTKNQILEVQRFKKLQRWEELASGFHIPEFELSHDESKWINVAFSRYYGITGIRMPKEKVDNENESSVTGSNK